MTIAAFDAEYPDGADYVVVPAMSRDDDPAALAWIKAQAANGAIIVSVCAGAKVVAAAGVLDGKRATTHWYYRDELLKKHPDITYVPDRRLVVDGGVTTTTGITASLPMMLTLIEAIAGRDKAVAVAHDLGLAEWDARHASDAFTFTRPFATTVLGNVVAFWNRETLGVPLTPGVDEVTLAIVADAWSRTFRSRAVTFADGPDTVTTENGVRIVPDVARDAAPPETVTLSDAPTIAALDAALDAIGDRYGRATADVVAMQLEYPRELPRN
jgi:transcriptional regulator GlxA family with amidase domain